MRLRKRITGTGLLAGLALTATVLGAGPAQAASASPVSADHQGRDRVQVAPPASSGARPARATSPTISPSVDTGHIAPDGSYTCPDGDLCALAWDPTTSNWKIFYLYSCNKYALYYWNDVGYYFDNQIPGTVSYFYGQSGNPLTHFTPDQTQHPYNWTNVWSIRNC